MADITLTLEYLDPADYVPGVFPVRISAVSDDPALDPAVFVFHARNPQDPLPGDTFECVSSYQQQQELPIDAPIIVGPTPIPYYRKDSVEFYLLDPAELTDIWTIVKSDVRLLVDAIRFYDRIADQETYVVTL